MRSLFFLLIIVNLSYLVWGVAFSEKSAPSDVMPQLQGDHTLTLLTEQADNMLAKANTLPAGTNKNSAIKDSQNETLSPSMAPAKTCYSLGPILDLKDSKKLEIKLKQTGFKPKHKAITDKEPKSYWVYLPAEKTLDQAKVVVAQLKRANEDDYFIIRKGKFTNSISLGLYNGYSRAKIRVAGLKKIGFNPKIQTRYKDITRHWIDFQETDAKRLGTEVWEKIQKDNPLQKLARPCIAPSAKNN